MKVKNSLAPKPEKPKKSAMTLSLVDMLNPAMPEHPHATALMEWLKRSAVQADDKGGT